MGRFILENKRSIGKKYKWLLPQMSYRLLSCILVINNLVESSLRQTFDGVDAPNEFLVNIQRELVNFSWDNYHWTHQSILFLPKEEGGQGLVNLTSERASYLGL